MPSYTQEIPSLIDTEFDEFHGKYAIILLDGKGNKYTHYTGFEMKDDKPVKADKLIFDMKLEGDVQICARVLRETRRLLFLEDIVVGNVLLEWAHRDATEEKPTVYTNKKLPFGAVAKDRISGIFYRPSEPYTPKKTE